MKGSVKIMLSYDYCHFEVALSSDEDMTMNQINDMRIRCQVLADEAVRQYQKAKKMANERINLVCEKARIQKEVEDIKKIKSESEFTAEDKAKVKALEDVGYWEKCNYFYEDGELPF